MCVICIVAENAKNVKFNRKKGDRRCPCGVCVSLALLCKGRAVRDTKRFLGFPVGGRLGYLSKKLTHTKKPSLRKAFFVWIYFARVRYRKVTISARVQIRFGLNVVPLVPMVISLPTAQRTASA